MRSVATRQFLALLLVLTLQPARAAISGNSTFEVRPTNGVDTNGGGFVAGASGTDFSQQNAAQYTFSDLASSNGTTSPCVVSSASHSFVASDVGNLMQITAGTSWTTGFYQIVSVATNNATLDRACASAASVTAGTYAVGGALKTLTKMVGAMVAGNIGWVKAEATITTASQINFSEAGGNSGQMPAVNGYTTTRGDNGQVTVQASASVGNTGVIQISSAGLTLANFVVDCNSQTNSAGIWLNAGATRAWNLLVKNCTTNFGVDMNASSTTCTLCTVTNQTSGPAFEALNGLGDICMFCVAYSNSGGNGFTVGTNQFICAFCIAANNSGASSDGFNLQANQGSTVIFASIAYTNGRDGIRMTTLQDGLYTILNTITYGNTGWGINDSTAALPTGTQQLDYNAYGSNGSGNLTNVTAGAHDVTLSANPFVNAATQNFALNGTAGGGAGLKSTGFPGALFVGGTGFAAIGALQPTGGGGQSGFPIVQ